jgi:hypothetical protein
MLLPRPPGFLPTTSRDLHYPSQDGVTSKLNTRGSVDIPPRILGQTFSFGSVHRPSQGTTMNSLRHSQPGPGLPSLQSLNHDLARNQPLNGVAVPMATANMPRNTSMPVDVAAEISYVSKPATSATLRLPSTILSPQTNLIDLLTEVSAICVRVKIDTDVSRSLVCFGSQTARPSI